MAALAASGALLFSYASSLTFVGDSWELLAGRPDWSASTFLDPFNEHAIMLLALAFKVLLSAFGMESALPFHAVAIFLFLLCAVVMFMFMRRRVGDWFALGGAVLLLFMGAAYEDLLWEFQMCFFGSVATGVGAFVALDREDRFGDWLACALLVFSTAFSSLGVPFILATIARVWLEPARRADRAFVPLIPLALYVLWWLTSGHSAGSELGPEDLPELPRYIFDAAGAGIASLLGRQPIENDGYPPTLVQILTLILGACLIYWIGRRRQLSPGLIVVLVLTFSFWGLLALDRGPQRFSSRFQYPSGVFLLMILAEVLRGQRLPRLVNVLLAAVAAAAAIGGISLLDKAYFARWKPTSDTIQATLAAVDIAGSDAQPRYVVSFPPSIELPVRAYREAREKHGTPAYSEAELLTAADTEKRRADRVLAGAMGLSLLSPPASNQSAGDCSELIPAPEDQAIKRLPATASFQITNLTAAPIRVKVGRFSSEAPAQLGELSPRATALVRLPAGNSRRPWQVGVEGGGVRLCSHG